MDQCGPLENLINHVNHNVRGAHEICAKATLENTPKILFHGTYHGPRAHRIFQSKILNPENDLMWFTNSPMRAAYGYGFRPIHPITLKHDEKFFIIAVFPHENTDLKRWVMDVNAPTGFSKTEEYITDQELKLEDAVILELSQVKPIWNQIKKGEISTKEDFIQKLKITKESQQEIYKEIREHLQKMHQIA